MARGHLTEHIKKESQTFLDQPITVRELRLLPYIQYQLTNDKNIDPQAVNSEERSILMKWQDKGYLSEPSSNLQVSKPFWDFMCHMMWIAYVEYED